MTEEEKKLSEQAIEFFNKKDYDKSKSLYEEILKINPNKNELEEIVINKEELYNYLDNNKQLLIESYNINLDDYKTEWINKEYNTSELLYNKVIKLFSVANEDDNKFIIVQLIKYCNTLRQEYKYNKSN